MLLNDLRYSARTLRKSPVFTIAAVLTMTLSIGANTAVCSLVNSVLLRPLPFTAPDRLMQAAEKNDRLHIDSFGASVLNYLSWKEQNRSFQDLGAIAAPVSLSPAVAIPNSSRERPSARRSCPSWVSRRCWDAAFAKGKTGPEPSAWL